MGKAGGVPPFLQPHLYFRSVAVWEVFSLIPPLFALRTEGGDKCSTVHFTISPHLALLLQGV